MFSNYGISWRQQLAGRCFHVIAMKEGKSKMELSARRKVGLSRTGRPGRSRIGHSAQVWQQKAHIHHLKTQYLLSPQFLPNGRGNLSRLLIEPERLRQDPPIRGSVNTALLTQQTLIPLHSSHVKRHTSTFGHSSRHLNAKHSVLGRTVNSCPSFLLRNLGSQLSSEPCPSAPKTSFSLAKLGCKRV